MLLVFFKILMFFRDFLLTVEDESKLRQRPKFMMSILSECRTGLTSAIKMEEKDASITSQAVLGYMFFHRNKFY